MEGLPSSCTILQLAAARIQEIKATISKLDQCEHGARGFQNLPRNMQRRAVSHDPRRLPRYLRDKHKREMANKNKTTKRPSRRYRRHPTSLLNEYNRRQRENVWLETHIWHAKRFHMVKSWGYMLPDFPNTKAYHATVRAATKSCLGMDISYLCCIELSGHLREIMTAFNKVMSVDDMKKLQSPVVKNGSHWTRVTFYEELRLPKNVIGDIDILCLPKNEKSFEDSCKELIALWLWCHPSVHSEFLTLLIQLFSLTKVNMTQLSSTTVPEKYIECTSDCDSIDKVKENKLVTSCASFDRIPKYVNESNNTCLYVLKDTINRFRLIGPLSYEVLNKAFIPSAIIKSCMSSGAKSRWWHSFYSSDLQRSAHDKQVSVWNKCMHSTIPLQAIIPLTVRDPRAVLPLKKDPLISRASLIEELASINEVDWPVDSPLYSSEIRDEVTFTKQHDYALNAKRRELLVPGSDLPLTDEESRIPVIFVSNPPFFKGRGGGWDVILPAGWAANFWVCLSMCGAVAGGLQQEKMLSLERLCSLPIHEVIDTNSGKEHADNIGRIKRKEYFKQPPSCRQNFIKLGTQFPFYFPWDILSGHADYFVLRDKNMLHMILLGFHKLTHKDKINMACEPPSIYSNNVTMESILEKLVKYSNANAGCYVLVKLVVSKKGVLEPHSTICMPAEEDVESKIVVESQKNDDNHDVRIQRKEEHKKIRNILARKRKLERKRAHYICDITGLNANYEDEVSKRLKVVNDNCEPFLEKFNVYSQQMEDLWLIPEDLSIQSCSREIIGYVTKGGFCMTLGRSAGIGCITLNSLIALLRSNSARTQKGNIFVLVRSPKCLQYDHVLLSLYFWPP